MFSLPTPTIDLQPRERPNEPNKAVRFKRISAKQTERTQNVLSQTLAAPEHIRGVRLHSALRQKRARHAERGERLRGSRALASSHSSYAGRHSDAWRPAFSRSIRCFS